MLFEKLSRWVLTSVGSVKKGAINSNWLIIRLVWPSRLMFQTIRAYTTAAETWD